MWDLSCSELVVILTSEFEEGGKEDPQKAEAKQQRHDKIQRSVGRNAAPLQNLSNHVLGPSTPVQELELLRTIHKKGTWTLFIIPRRKSHDKDLGNATFVLPGEMPLQTALQQIAEHFNLQWIRKNGHLLDLKPNDDCCLRFLDNISLDAETEPMTIQEVYTWYQNRPDRHLVNAGTIKYKLPKGASIVFELHINEQRYKDRLQALEGADDTDSTVGQKRRNSGLSSSATAQKRSGTASSASLTSRFRGDDDYSALSIKANTFKVKFETIHCESDGGDEGRHTLSKGLSIQTGHMHVDTLILSLGDRFSIEGDEQPYVAKKIFDIGKGSGVDITKKINCSLLGRDLVRLKRLGWFRDRFEAFALGKGLTDLAAFEVSDAFMILVKKDDEEDVQSGTEDDSDEEDAYLIEPLRTSSIVTKYTGTFGSTRESDKLSATILTFGHYIMHDTACLMAFADLQGSRHKRSLVLFDPMMHTVKGQSGAGDHGEDGIKDAIESHLCNSFCKALDLSDQDVLLNSLRNRVSEEAEAEDHHPEDSVLVDAFTRYSRENSGAGLSTKDQLVRLLHEFKLDIGKTKLFEIRKRLGIPTVKNSRKLRTDVETRQLVIDLKESDIAGGWGVNQVKGRLANAGVLIPRDSLRQILHNEFDEEFENRFVGIHLPIYASKDQFAALVHDLVVMPNVRNGTAIAHYYLDLVERRGFIISIQMTTDMGSEVNEAHKIHETLRDEVAPEYVPPAWPHGLKQSSTNNTPIEGFWRWLRAGSGHSTKTVLQEGAQTGIFIPNDDIHRQTFYSLWVPLVQEELDTFRDYWNNHKLQKSKDKLNPSGSSPLNMLLNPTSVVATARDCSIRVNPETVYRLREAYGGEEARGKAFRFVSREFQAEADGVYVDLGCPTISLATGWGIFTQVVTELEKCLR
ncbi:hypothetical protein C8J57DRAFT_1512195 [Mycena rebaudengoi]|nr:hypothetical protein C8J57DRAFT_1512195 [Mycena rebaudengoi]